MADNATLPATGDKVASDEVTYSGDTTKLQLVRLVTMTGAEGSKTVVELIKAEDSAHSSGDSGLPVFMAVRQDALAALAGDGDYLFLTTDAQGRLNVTPSATVNINGAFTRPSDTTAYAAGDVAADATSGAVVITFTNCARVNAGSGVILDALLIDSANQSTKGLFELWLFDTTVTMDQDNAAFTPTDTELATLVAVISFTSAFVGDATAGAGGNAVYPGIIQGRGMASFVTGAASKNLFGVLVVRNAYTPVSAEVFTIRLRILQD